jgi:hypothetical protein
MRKGYTSEAVTGDEYGGKIRIKGNGGSRRGGYKNRLIACFLIHFKFPCFIRSSSAGGVWAIVFKLGIEAGLQGTSERGG